MTSKAKQKYFKVFSINEDEPQSDFENDMYFVRYKVKGACYMIYFTPNGISIELDDAESKNTDYRMNLQPHQNNFSFPGVDISVKQVGE